MSKFKELSEQQIDFIRSNIATMPKEVICARLHTSQHILNRHLKQYGIKIPEAPCVNCGELFQPKSPRNRYCAKPECRRASNRRPDQHVKPDWNSARNVSETHLFYAAKDAICGMGWGRTAKDFNFSPEVFREGILRNIGLYESYLRKWCAQAIGHEDPGRVNRCLNRVRGEAACRNCGRAQENGGRKMKKLTKHPFGIKNIVWAVFGVVIATAGIIDILAGKGINAPNVLNIVTALILLFLSILSMYLDWEWNQSIMLISLSMNTSKSVVTLFLSKGTRRRANEIKLDDKLAVEISGRKHVGHVTDLARGEGGETRVEMTLLDELQHNNCEAGRKKDEI